MTRCNILSTKKLLPEIIDQAKHSGIAIQEIEFITVKPIMTKDKWDEVFHWIESKIECVVFTSAHAVEAIQKYLHPYINCYDVKWKIYCLSGRTKEVVEASGDLMGDIIATADNAITLAKKIWKQQVKEIIFFCGDQHRDELPDFLSQHGIVVHDVIVYQTEETPTLAATEFDGVLFFSPSAVNSFFSLNRLRAETVCFAIGQTTANAIADFTSNPVIISENPSQAGMLAALGKLGNNIST